MQKRITLSFMLLFMRQGHWDSCYFHVPLAKCHNWWLTVRVTQLCNLSDWLTAKLACPSFAARLELSHTHYAGVCCRWPYTRLSLIVSALLFILKTKHKLLFFMYPFCVIFAGMEVLFFLVFFLCFVYETINCRTSEISWLSRLIFQVSGFFYFVTF